MRRIRVLGAFLTVSAAFLLAGMVPARAPVPGTDGAAQPHVSVGGGHAAAPTAAVTAMAYDEADGDTASEPTVGSAGVASKPLAPHGAFPTPSGADPACANRASRQALSAHPSTAPPVRI